MHIEHDSTTLIHKSIELSYSQSNKPMTRHMPIRYVSTEAECLQIGVQHRMNEREQGQSSSVVRRQHKYHNPFEPAGIERARSRIVFGSVGKVIVQKTLMNYVK